MFPSGEGLRLDRRGPDSRRVLRVRLRRQSKVGLQRPKPLGNFVVASLSEIAGEMITSPPCFQSTGVETDAAVATGRDEPPSDRFAPSECAQGSVQLELITVAHLPQERDWTGHPGAQRTVISITREGGYGGDETE